MRCKLEEGDLQKRCGNCIKRKKECIFRPVDQHDTSASEFQSSKTVTSMQNTYPPPEPTSRRQFKNADYRGESYLSISPNVATASSNPPCGSGVVLPGDKAFGSGTFTPSVSDLEKDKLRTFESLDICAQSRALCAYRYDLTSSTRCARGLVDEQSHLYWISDGMAALGQCFSSSGIKDGTPSPVHYDMVTPCPILTDTSGQIYPSIFQDQVPESTTSVLGYQRSRKSGSQEGSSDTKGLAASTIVGETPEARWYLNSSLDLPMDLDKSLSIERRGCGHDRCTGCPLETIPRNEYDIQAVYRPVATTKPRWMSATSSARFLQLGDTLQDGSTTSQYLFELSKHPCSATLQANGVPDFPDLDFAFDTAPQPQLNALPQPQTETCNPSFDDYQDWLRIIFTQLRAGDLEGIATRLTHVLRYLQTHISAFGTRLALSLIYISNLIETSSRTHGRP